MFVHTRTLTMSKVEFTEAPAGAEARLKMGSTVSQAHDSWTSGCCSTGDSGAALCCREEDFDDPLAVRRKGSQDYANLLSYSSSPEKSVTVHEAR